MALDNYVGPPLHQLTNELVQMWGVMRKAIDDGLKMPSLSADIENRFLTIKAEIIKKSRMILIVSEGRWSLHEKIKGLLNMVQSLEYLRQETQIMHDNIRNQWHDNFIQASKSAAVFESEFKEE